MWDGIGPSDCAITDWTFTYNQGKFIESAGLLADLTGDAKYVTWMQDAIIGGTKGAPWTGTDDGIITEGQETPQSENGDGRGFKGLSHLLLLYQTQSLTVSVPAIFIRSLAIANNRDVNSGNTGLQDLVRSYIDVQVCHMCYHIPVLQLTKYRSITLFWTSHEMEMTTRRCGMDLSSNSTLTDRCQLFKF